MFIDTAKISIKAGKGGGNVGDDAERQDFV